jgi:hypothetical protein
MSKHEVKRLNVELKKTQAEYDMILKTLKTTEYNRDENPATYTTDELTVARAINNAILCMKLHQLFCENHNPVLQDALRLQCNKDGSSKINSFDFPSYYAKMLESFQKIMNNNTIEVGLQTIDILVEAIQGPCKANQKAMVQEKIFDSCREYIASFEKEADLELLQITSDEDIQGVQEFKCKIMELLVSLIEGEVDLEIMSQMAFSLDIGVLKERMLKVYKNFVAEVRGMSADEVDVNNVSLLQVMRQMDRFAFDSTIQECFQIYILFNSMNDTLEDQKDILKMENFSMSQRKALEFVKHNTARIEVKVRGKLQRVYFPIKPECRELSVGLRDQFNEGIDRTSQKSKVDGLMDTVPDLLDEMEANWELKEALLPITPQFLQQLKDMSTYVGLMINCLYLIFATRDYHYREPYIEEWVVSSIEYLGYI